ncbi:MAG: TauD/TfdA family dioxygenase [Rhodospirillaceae bacterium]|nr:TauD/TfdA family dioxygenase [Rhodospirillaceae bacterium]
MALELSPLSEHTGIEARGVDLSQPLDADSKERLNRAFVEHSVLVIRDQTLSAVELRDGVQNFGEIFPQHNTRFALPDCPEIHYLSNKDRYPDGTRYIPGAGYHTDHSNSETPPKATLLLAIELPDSGGDTQYVNMAAAYEALPDATKDRIADLKAMHVYQSKHSARKLMGLTDAAKQKVPDAVYHPIVRTHPESGRKSIYINPIRIDAIEGMAEADALDLLNELLSHATEERFQYRHKWQPGDLVMWDNRCLLHKANGDYDHETQTRYLYRVMLQGDRPV